MGSNAAHNAHFNFKRKSEQKQHQLRVFLAGQVDISLETRNKSIERMLSIGKSIDLIKLTSPFQPFHCPLRLLFLLGEKGKSLLKRNRLQLWN